MPLPPSLCKWATFLCHCCFWSGQTNYTGSSGRCASWQFLPCCPPTMWSQVLASVPSSIPTHSHSGSRQLFCAQGCPSCVRTEHGVLSSLFNLKCCRFCPPWVCPDFGIKTKIVKSLLIAICLAQEIVSEHPHRRSPAVTLEPDWSLGYKNRCFTYRK